MEITGTNIRMVRGDSESIGIKISGYTLTEGDFIEFTVRKYIGSPIFIYKKESNFVDNSISVNIYPEDTNNLDFGDYIYDIQLTYGGSVKTIIRPSRFTIGEEVTYGNNSSNI